MKQASFFGVGSPAFSSERGDWETPLHVLELVRQVGPIALDPCTTILNSTGARVIYTDPQIVVGPPPPGVAWAPDGLDELNSWVAPAITHEGLVFCNPPYGSGISAWIKRCAEVRRAGVEAIALVPARTDTSWWHALCAPPVADAVCFWRGRLTFVGAPAPAPFPSALVYWGPNRFRFADVFADVGLIWT